MYTVNKQISLLISGEKCWSFLPVTLTITSHATLGDLILASQPILDHFGSQWFPTTYESHLPPPSLGLGHRVHLPPVKAGHHQHLGLQTLPLTLLFLSILYLPNLRKQL